MLHGDHAGRSHEPVPAYPTPIDDPRIYLAAERTFLAWIRTFVSLMGFGFLIARFALFIRGYGLTAGPQRGPAGGFELARVRHGLCRCGRLRDGGPSPSRLYPGPRAGRRQPAARRQNVACRWQPFWRLVGLAIALNIFML